MRKHPRMTLAMLMVLCAVVAMVLYAQGSKNMPTQSPSQPKEQTMTAGADAQPAEVPGADVPATTDANPTPAEGSTTADPAPAVSAATATQSSESAQVNDSAASVPTTANVPAAATTASTEKSAVTEDLQRQMRTAVSHAEKPKVSPDAAYEPGVVLVSVRKGATAAQVSRAMADAGVKTVDHNDIEVVTDDLMKAKLAANASIDDAIYELESTGVAKGAQPNYLYEIAEELTPVADVGLKREGATTPGVSADAEVAGPKAPVASEPATESAPGEVHSETQSDGQPATDTQSMTPTSARDFLNDTYANNQWGLDSIDALAAWEFPALKNATTTVGVGIVDNGFGDTHEDLADNVRSTYSVATKLENVPVTPPPGTPDPNHGSHVAGIVGATSNNQKGVSGVGFNHLKLSLVSITRASNPGSISTSDVVEGFDYLIKHKNQYNIRVANMSIGGGVRSLPDPKDDAILNEIDKAYDKGIVTVASAGNRTTQYNVPYINYPSEYKNVVSVMNLRNTDSANPKSVERSPSSNYNAEGMSGKDIAAPGTDIYSTYPTGYGTMSGTSMAAPHVAGVMGLMFTVNPALSPVQAKEKLYSSARDLNDARLGHGEVNAAAAVRAAAAAVIQGPEYLAVGSTATYSVTSDSAGWTFSSTNPSILTIDASGSATAVSTGKATVNATKENTTISQEVTVLGPITGKSLVAIDGFTELAVTTPDGCGDLAWSWSSSNEGVAKVAESGTVYGKSAGTVTITATLVSDSNVQLNYVVTVYDAVKGDAYVPMGSTTVLTPEIPAELEGATISWSSENEQVATVEKVDQGGKVTAVQAGGAVVSCTIGEGDNAVTNAWRVYVYGPIEGDTSTGVGQNTPLKVAGIDLLSEELQTGWTWSLGSGSDSAVAVVSEDGVVTGKKPGQVTVTATRLSGDSQVSFSYGVSVTALSLADAKVTIPKQTYSGKNLTPVPEVTLDGSALTAGTDYEVVEQTIVNVGSYDVVIRGKGNYSGTVTGIFMVEPKRLTPPKPVTGLVYNGKEQTGIPAGEGYALRGHAKETDAGEYMATAVVTDQVNTCWNDNDPYYDIDWKIEECPISNVTVSGLGTYVFNGSAYTPKPTVMLGDMTLTEGTDYTLSYANNVNVGTATVTLLTGENVENFKGTKQAAFTIVPASLSSASVTGLSTQIYTGKFLTPKPTVTLAGKTLREGTDYTLTYKNNLEPGTATVTVTGKGNYAGTKAATFKIVYPSCSVAYRTHVQNDGWRGWVRDGAVSGTTDQALRLEGVNLKLEGQSYTGSIEYRTHVQNIGWEGSWQRDGALSGTTGQSLRLEAIQIRLTGEMAEHYDVWYRVHCQAAGWMGWAKNGERAGTATYGYRLEALEVMLLRKGSAAPGSTVGTYQQQLVGYSTHVQNIGWQEQVADGDASGTSGQSLRLEGIRIGLQQKLYAGSIEYRTHVQNIGWEGSWARDGALSGTTGRGLRLEAIQIRLTGEMAEHYDVWYRAHVQGIGWMDWVKNGENAGTTNRALRLEAIKVKLTPRT